MAKIVNVLRKNDYCAVATSHSFTKVLGATERYTRIALAQVAKASREGLATRVTFAGKNYSDEITSRHTVFALSAHQVQARRLFVATKAPTDYADKDEFKAALTAAVDTLIEA